MRITFLGTGTSTGIPVVGCNCPVCQSKDPHDKRMRTSALIDIKSSNTKILIDAGPDFRYQMLKSQTARLDAILLTHEHYDHIGGMDDVRGINYSMNADVNVYAPQRTVNNVKRMLFYVFEANPYPGVPRIAMRPIDENPFTVKGVEIIPLPVMHDKLPIFGYRIGKLAYVTDASYVPDTTIEKMRGVDILVLNALGPRPHHSHLNVAQALEIVEQVQPREAYFTHISPMMGFHAEASKTLPPHVHLAYDGLVVEI